MKRLVAVAGLVLAAVVLVLAGCDDGYREDPAAQRLNAQANVTRANAEADARRAEAPGRAAAEREKAEAAAYEQRQSAAAAAAGERANVRQMERDAAHQRTLDLLPFVVAIGGGLALAGFGAFLVWDLRRRPVQPMGADPAMLVYLDRLRLDQAQQWRALAQLERRTLPAMDNEKGVVIYDDTLR